MSSVDARAVLAEALTELRAMRAKLEAAEREKHEPIAVIGLGCRFPGGGDTPEGLWKLLADGASTIRELPPERWYLAGPDAPDMRFASLLERVADFDPMFFGISPREAVGMDPQQRVLLEVACEALERAGAPLDRLNKSRTGVFIGCCNNDYAQLVNRDPSQVDTHAVTGLLPSVLAGRIAYLLGLEGPCAVIDTACSSSLTAVHLAVQSLRRKECELALAGGVNLVLLAASNHLVSKIAALSPDGVVRTFDAGANGMVRGEGCGVVVLKRLSDALRDGDLVRAVIRGTAINQDGRSTSLTSPNVLSQEDVIRAALADGGIEAGKVGLVEAHGTGTALGDPIEMEGLRAIYGAPRPDGGRCYVGAVKTNLAHTEAAAGVTGLLKLVLALERGEIPPNLNFSTLNPRIALEGSALALPLARTPWPAPRVGAVSSFGISGSNAHAIVEQAPPSLRLGSVDERPQLLVLSARSDRALLGLAERWRATLAHTAAPLVDLSYGALARRARYERRVAVVGRTHAEWAAELAAFAEAPRHPPRRERIAFVFSGQGGQWAGMGLELLREEPAFRAALEAVDAQLRARGGASILAALESRAPLQDISCLQPVVFGIQVAWAALLASHGVRPAAVVGHSLGEAAAAYVAGALSLEDAAQLVSTRSELIESLRGHGDMLLTGLDRADAQAAIGGRAELVSIAACNGPRTTVLSGAIDALSAIQAELEARGVFARMVKAGAPGHSPQFEPLKHELVRRLQLSPRASTVPYYSTVRAAVVPGHALDARYFGDNLREPVLFFPTVERMLADGCDLFLEIGPHPVLASSIEETLRSSGREASVVGVSRRDRSERVSLLATLGALFEAGLDPSYAPAGRLADMPTYAWEHEPYFIRPPSSDAPRRGPVGPHPLLGAEIPLSVEPETRVFEAEIDLDRAAFFRDHRVLGSIVFPAAGYLDLVWTAASKAFGELRAIEDVRFLRLLTLKDEERRRLQIVLVRRASDRLQFSVSSQVEGGFDKHITGVVRLGPKLPVMERPRVGDAPRTLDGAAFYAALEPLGLRFGPTFKGVAELRVAGGVSETRVEVPAALEGTIDRFAAHPALLDVFFQTMGGFVLGERSLAEALDTLLPTELGRIVFHRALGTRVAHASARLLSAEGGATTASLLVVDDAGAPVVEVERFTVKRLGRELLTDDLREWLLVSRWVAGAPTPAPTAPARVRLVGAEAGLAAAIEALGGSVEAGEAPTIVVYGGGTLEGLVALLRELVGLPSPPRLYAVARSGTLEAAALLGFMRSLAYEHAELRPSFVEHDGELTALARELLGGSDETQVSLKGSERRVARLARSERVPRSAEIELAAEATQLITGGLGSLGLHLAEYLVARGARSLVLAGRSAPSQQAAARISALRARGASVEVVALDVSRRDEVERLVGRLPRLSGVFHLAVTLDDGAAIDLDAPRIERVFAAKLRGAEHLAEATRDRALDHLVFFSSASAILGSPGQASYAAANAAVDALADRLAAEGRPAMALDLGVFEVAAGQTERLRERGAKVLGVSMLTSSLGRLLATPRLGAIGLFGVDLDLWARFYPFVNRTPYYARQAVAPAPRAELRARVLAAPVEQRLALVEAHLREEVGRVLRIPASRFEHGRSWASYGIDSLMGLEIRNRLEASTGLQLPAIVLYAEPNLGALSAHLLSKLVPREATPPAPAPAPPAAAPAPPVEAMSEAEATKALEARLAALRGKRR